MTNSQIRINLTLIVIINNYYILLYKCKYKTKKQVIKFLKLQNLKPLITTTNNRILYTIYYKIKYLGNRSQWDIIKQRL